MIRVVAIGARDSQTICETRWLAAATATAVAMSTRSTRRFQIVDVDGTTLGHAIAGRLLDALGEPMATRPIVWS